jgi:hypothetical protein
MRKVAIGPMPLVLRVAAVAVCLGTVARSAAACSLRLPWSINDPAMVPFIGTPTADTVVAGNGAIRPIEAVGHFGIGRARDIYGQRVRIDQLGERARRVMPRGVTHVVLVPWDYAMGCEEVPWSRSARWLPETATGLFRARLRAVEHWANGEPTFDLLTTNMQPYRETPAARTSPYESDYYPSKRLSARALLAFYDEVPPDRLIPDSAAALAFARRLLADSALAGRYPVTDFIYAARREIRDAKRVGIRVPIAGTFRVEATIFDSARVFFLRTAPQAMTLQEWSRGVVDTSLVMGDPEGYEVYASAAVAETQLALNCHETTESTLAYIDVDWHAPIAADGVGAWKAGFDGRFFPVVLSTREQANLRQWGVQARQRMLDSIRAVPDSVRRREVGSPWIYIPHRPLRAVQPSDGPMYIVGSLQVDGLGTIRVRANRISAQTMSCSF